MFANIPKEEVFEKQNIKTAEEFLSLWLVSDEKVVAFTRIKDMPPDVWGIILAELIIDIVVHTEGVGKVEFMLMIQDTILKNLANSQLFDGE